MTALVNSNVTFRCPIVSDLEPYIEWIKVAEYPGDQEDSPKGSLLKVQPPFNAVMVEGPSLLSIASYFNFSSRLRLFDVISSY